MNILKSIYIAQEEWENIRLSLQKCGDIGPYCVTGKNNKVKIIHGDYKLISKLNEMRNRFKLSGYYSPEASFVFEKLGTRAAYKLGLTGEFAKEFGILYSLFRTEYLVLNIDVESDNATKNNFIRQFFYYEQLFPIGEYHNWNFGSAKVKNKLKGIFDKLKYWQENSDLFGRELKKFSAESTNSLDNTVSMATYLARHNLGYLRHYYNLDMAS